MSLQAYTYKLKNADFLVIISFHVLKIIKIIITVSYSISVALGYLFLTSLIKKIYTQQLLL